MIIRGDAAGDVETRIKAHMADIWAVLPELESGFQLKAETGGRRGRRSSGGDGQ